MQATLGHNDLTTETRARAIGGIVLISRELRLRLRFSDEIIGLPEVNFPVARETYLKKPPEETLTKRLPKKDILIVLKTLRT